MPPLGWILLALTVTPLTNGFFRPLNGFSAGAEPSCKDRSSDCTKRSDLCYNPLYDRIMTLECPQTCGKCQAHMPKQTRNEVIEDSKGCFDRASTCKPTHCIRSVDMFLGATQCRKTCGFCNPNSKPSKNNSFNGGGFADLGIVNSGQSIRPDSSSDWFGYQNSGTSQNSKPDGFGGDSWGPLNRLDAVSQNGESENFGAFGGQQSPQSFGHNLFYGNDLFNSFGGHAGQPEMFSEKFSSGGGEGRFKYCMDRADNCAVIAYLCLDKRYSDLMSFLCPRTCHRC
ncbi:hypothetical protein L596_023067 [Steinernema carpocapsae]|uniref:ShKT domain-containing protein n=1 Tax=Steinernema carpocapsae TaxID=34508 RepID=A0A4U5MCH8_STECR|nr:hypothetical protein L596_023067 [Steinernema carpocapsae]